MRIFLLLAFLFSISTNSNAQYEDVRFDDYVYVTNIKSVKFHPRNEPLLPPVTYLNTRLPLVLTFDDVDNELKDFTYEIVHCNRFWEPSQGIQRIDYIEGFQDEELQDYEFSVNTFIPYINYKLTIPNEDLKYLLSGNYLLIVYEGEDSEDRIPIITRRFFVVDRKVTVNMKFHRPMKVSNRDTHHSFDLKVNTKDFNIIDPMDNIFVTIVQNNRWNTATNFFKPKFILGDDLVIDNADLISFPALKEFRSADIRSLDFGLRGVEQIVLQDDGTDVALDIGIPRSDGYYITSLDANGQFVIQNRDANNLGDGLDLSDRAEYHTRADYANVTFRLSSPYLEEEVYVMGAFTDWQPDEMYRMQYDDLEEMYTATILLKQGYYDYYYGVEKDGILDARAIEGSWGETENDYQVFVYLREPGTRYDRLVGFYTY